MLFLLLFFAPTITGPQPAALIQACQEVRFSQGQTQNGQKCLFFIAGLVDGQQHATQDNPTLFPVCFPPNVTLGQMVTAVLKYADEHPNALPDSSAALVTNALRVTFPCSANR